MKTPPKECNLFWGSHGCDLNKGHEGFHICDSQLTEGPCCEFNEGNGHVRWFSQDGISSLGEWKYYGKPFRMEGL